MRRFTIVIFVLAIIHNTLLKGFGFETQNKLPDSPPASSRNAILYVPKGIDTIKSHMGSIYLQTVNDGKMRTLAFSSKELLPDSELRVEGYVTGLVIQGSRQMEVHIGGRKMDKIRNNADGSVSIKNFGNYRSDSLGISDSLNPYYQAREAKQSLSRKEGGVVPGFYSFFPEIVGEPICSDTKVDIAFTVDGRTVRVSLLNPRYVNLSVNQPTSEKRDPIVFRYLGSRLQDFENRLSDFQDRVNAIKEGILAVEHALGMKLVSNVNLIDYEAIHDAVTAKEKLDIWYYISSFSQESPEELKSMAEHETIHIYVDRKNLTGNSEIRQEFADLKGYDEWSLERFELVTTGKIRRRSTVHKIEENPFFAFIDERNFQAGRLGGHSHSDLDEFCTSFIHSLMFFGRLNKNLEKPIKFRDQSQPPLRLTAGQKTTILNTYINVLKIVSKALAEEDGKDEAAGPAYSLFQQALYKLRNLS